MSISRYRGSGWGPSHQYLPPPRERKGHLFAWSIGLGLVLFALSSDQTVALWGLGVGGLALLGYGLQSFWGSHTQSAPAPPPRAIDAAAVRAKSLRLGGGAYLGL